MPTLLEKKQALEKELRELQTDEQKAAAAKQDADEAFIAPIVKRLQGDRFHAASIPETCIIVRAVLTELGLIRPTSARPSDSEGR